MSLGIKHRYFYGKNYVETDSTERQEAVETAIARIFLKRKTYGLLGDPTSPPSVTAIGSSFEYRINSGGSDPVQGHDKTGLFVTLDANPYDTDDLKTPGRTGGEIVTPSAGNDQYFTLVLRFVEEDAQPETEELTFNTVYFRREASFQIGVVAGSEAPTGTAVKPSLAAEDGIYLCDILVHDTDVDSSTTVITFDKTRCTVDPIYEAVLRGLNGVDGKIVLSSLDSGLLQFSDIDGSSSGLEDALKAAVAQSPSTANRVALLADRGGGSFVYVNAIIDSAGSVSGIPGDTGDQVVDLSPYVTPGDVPKIWIVKAVAYRSGQNVPSTNLYASIQAGPVGFTSVAPSFSMLGSASPFIVAATCPHSVAIPSHSDDAVCSEFFIQCTDTVSPFRIQHRMAGRADGGTAGGWGTFLELIGYLK